MFAFLKRTPTPLTPEEIQALKERELLSLFESLTPSEKARLTEFCAAQRKLEVPILEKE